MLYIVRLSLISGFLYTILIEQVLQILGSLCIVVVDDDDVVVVVVLVKMPRLPMIWNDALVVEGAETLLVHGSRRSGRESGLCGCVSK
jgi:hypothetical protein